MGKPKVQMVNSKPMHFSVGAIVERDGKYFMLNRLKEPLGWAGIAGHIDEGETITNALRREVDEEGKFVIVSALFVCDEIDNTTVCRHGVDCHHWFLFRCIVSGKGEHNTDESKGSGWFTPEEIRELELEPVWNFWLKKLKII